jgi:nitrate/TMAO reductase-like tetraheme cytochrome c subunit
MEPSVYDAILLCKILYFVIGMGLFLLLVLQPSFSLDHTSDDPPFFCIRCHSFQDVYSYVSKVFFSALELSYLRSSYPSVVV